jgi:hypothetical protein
MENAHSANPKPKRRWYQYSLRTLMIFVTMFAVMCSWFAVKMQQARRQREAVEAIQRIGGLVEYDYEMAPYTGTLADCPRRGPLWLRTLFGDDFFSDVVYVIFMQANVTEADLEHLKALPRLQQLFLNNPQVTDAYLERLKGLNSLHWLDLDYAQITDAGLEHLKGLIHLYRLSLDDTQIRA